MGNSPRVEALRRQSYAIYQRYAELAPTSPETLLSVLSSDDPGVRFEDVHFADSLLTLSYRITER